MIIDCYRLVLLLLLLYLGGTWVGLGWDLDVVVTTVVVAEKWSAV